MADTVNGSAGAKGRRRTSRASGSTAAPRAPSASPDAPGPGEALTTVNAQLQEKLERLDASNSDLANLLTATRIATLILDRELRIKHFTPAIEHLFKLLPSDAGRPIDDFSPRFADYDLSADARAVARGEGPREREVRHADGSFYLVRVLPYLEKGERVAGVVATFNDVTGLRRAEEQTRRLAAIVADSNDAVIVFDAEGRIQLWNRGAQQAYGWSEAAAATMNIRDLTPPEAAVDPAGLVRRLQANDAVTSLQTLRRTRDGRLREVWQTLTALRDGSGAVTAIASTERDVTERNRVQEQLRQAKEEADHQRLLLEAVMEALPVGVAITDEAGGLLHANDAFDRIWGGPRSRPRPARDGGGDDAVYRAWWADTGLPLAPGDWASARALGAGEPVFGQLLEIEGADGLRRTVINSAAPVRDAGGRILGAAVALMDISELRQAQQLLLQSQERLALTASATRIGMFDWDLVGGDVLWTRAHEVLFGYAPPVDQGTTALAATTETRRYDYRAWADRVHPADLPQVEAQVRRCLSEGTPFEAQYRVVWPDGSVHWVDSRAAFLDDSTGKALHMLGVVMDITERKRVEEELRRKREDLDRAQAVSHVGSWRLDVRSNELLWSPENWRIFGVAPGTPLTYETFLAAVHPDDRERVDRRWQAALRGEPYDVEHRIVVDGQLKWVRERAELEFDAQGTLLGGFGTTQDVTDRKATEEQLQRTAALLARSNQDLEHFAYIASHDLQEPLRMVTGFLGLLKERYAAALDAKAERWIFHAMDGAKRMSVLIEDLLAFSRADRIDLKVGPTSVQKAVNRAWSNLRAGVAECDAAISHDALPTVLADGTQLTLLFQNLIGNALKFKSDQRPCRIHVGARRDGAQWVLFVRDNGIGIPAEQFDRIFLIFQRLHSRGKHPGTGIGLAICKRIVERHGGRIWVESTPGEGSTFYFTMPADEAAA
jgi:PAS domain S-box-containing protein